MSEVVGAFLDGLADGCVVLGGGLGGRGVGVEGYYALEESGLENAVDFFVGGCGCGS